jgi:hypothetical protein
VGDHRPSPSSTPPPVEHATPPSTDLDYDHREDVPLRFNGIDNILGPTTVSRLAKCALHEELYIVSAEEPASLEEPMHEPSWHKAMVEEL